MIEGSLFYIVYTVPCFEGMSYVDIRLLFHLAGGATTQLFHNMAQHTRAAF